jgi:hypothetical protein
MMIRRAVTSTNSVFKSFFSAGRLLLLFSAFKHAIFVHCADTPELPRTMEPDYTNPDNRMPENTEPMKQSIGE